MTPTRFPFSLRRKSFQHIFLHNNRHILLGNHFLHAHCWKKCSSWSFSAEWSCWPKICFRERNSFPGLHQSNFGRSNQRLAFFFFSNPEKKELAKGHTADKTRASLFSKLHCWIILFHTYYFQRFQSGTCTASTRTGQALRKVYSPYWKRHQVGLQVYEATNRWWEYDSRILRMIIRSWRMIVFFLLSKWMSVFSPIQMDDSSELSTRKFFLCNNLIWNWLLEVRPIKSIISKNGFNNYISWNIFKYFFNI